MRQLDPNIFDPADITRGLSLEADEQAVGCPGLGAVIVRGEGPYQKRELPVGGVWCVLNAAGEHCLELPYQASGPKPARYVSEECADHILAELADAED